METRKEEVAAIQEAIDLIEKAWDKLDCTRWFLDVSEPINEVVKNLALGRDALTQQLTRITSDVEIEIEEVAEKDDKVIPFNRAKVFQSPPKKAC